MFENNIRKENLVLGFCSKYFLNPHNIPSSRDKIYKALFVMTSQISSKSKKNTIEKKLSFLKGFHQL